MAIGSINSINPFMKGAAAISSINMPVDRQQSASIFSQNQNTQSIDKVNGTSNPFYGGPISEYKGPAEKIAPVNAKENYQNGLAPADNLQSVYAGMYKGKANICNQICIA